MSLWEIHPALVHFPLTLLLAATALEIAAAVKRHDFLNRIAARVLAAGVIAALVAAVAGLVAYFTVPAHTEAAHARILVHALCAASATIVYGVVLVLHSQPPSEVSGSRRLIASIVAATLLCAAGALGGYVVYQDGVGVKKTQEGALGNWEHHWQNLLGE
jgi:uncharacterized membrane protein